MPPPERPPSVVKPDSEIPDHVWEKCFDYANPAAYLRKVLPQYVPAHQVEQEIKEAYAEWGDKYYPPDEPIPDAPDDVKPVNRINVLPSERAPFGGESGIPFIYHPQSGNLYTGQPSWLHWDVVNNHPDLSSQYAETSFGGPRNPDYLHGRLHNDDDRVQWYDWVPGMAPVSPEQKKNVEKELGGIAAPDDDEDIWEDHFSSFRQAFDQALPPTVEEQRLDPQEERRIFEQAASFKKRRPFIYDLAQNRIILGQPGFYHQHILNAHPDGPLLERDFGYNSRVHHGFVWTHDRTTDWYKGHANTEQKARAVNALSQHLGIPLGPDAKEDEDDLWED